MTLGAGAASGVAWLVARYRRDRLVAEAGAVAHPHDDDRTASAASAAEALGPMGDDAAAEGARESGASGTDEAADASATGEETLDGAPIERDDAVAPESPERGDGPVA